MSPCSSGRHSIFANLRDGYCISRHQSLFRWKTVMTCIYAQRLYQWCHQCVECLRIELWCTTSVCRWRIQLQSWWILQTQWHLEKTFGRGRYLDSVKLIPVCWNHHVVNEVNIQLVEGTLSLVLVICYTISMQLPYDDHVLFCFPSDNHILKQMLRRTSGTCSSKKCTREIYNLNGVVLLQLRRNTHWLPHIL